MKRECAMTNSVKDFALKAAISLTLTGILGAALFGFADFATSGVIV